MATGELAFSVCIERVPIFTTPGGEEHLPTLVVPRALTMKIEYANVVIVTVPS